MCQHGQQHFIVIDNGLQLTDADLEQVLSQLSISHKFSLVDHPQGNEQAKAINKVILTKLRKKLGRAKGL